MVVDSDMRISLKDSVEKAVADEKEKWNGLLTESFNAVTDARLVDLAQNIAVFGLQSLSIPLDSREGGRLISLHKPLSKEFITANLGFLSFCDRVKEAGFADPQVKTGHGNNNNILLEMDLAKK